MREISIKWRLIIGFACLILVIFAIAGIVTYEFDRTQEIAHTISSDIANRLRSAGNLAVSISRKRNSLRSYLETGDKQHYSDYTEAITGIDQSIAELKLSTRGTDEEHWVLDISRVMPQIRRDDARAIAEMTAGHKQEALAYYEDNIDPRSSAALKDAQALSDHESLNISTMSAELNVSRGRTIMIAWVLFCVSVVLALVSTVLTIKSVTTPAAACAAAAEAVESGDYALAAELAQRSAGSGKGRRRNELRRISAAIARMAGVLDRRETSLAAHVDLAAVCSSTIDVQELADRTLTELAEHTNSQIGAMYLIRSGVAGAAARFGISDESAAEALTGSDGLMEHVVSSGKIVVLDNIPSDTRLAVRLGLGSMIPKAMVCVPLAVEDRRLGAIVLASLYGYDSDALRLMEAAASEISIAVTNAFRHEEISHLADDLIRVNHDLDMQNDQLQLQYEEMQAQSEEIQAQSEEIAAQNEELAAQAVEMQSQNEMLTQLTHDLRGLQTVTAAALTSIEPIVLMKRLLEAVIAAVGLQAGVILLLKNDGRTLHSTVWHNVDIADPEAWTMASDEGFPGQALRSKDLCFTTDVASASSYLAATGASFAVGVPFIVDDLVSGVAILADKTVREFTEAEKDLLKAFAVRATVSIDRARSYEKLREAEKTVRIERDRLHSIIENIPEAVVIASAPEGQLEIANRAALELLGIGKLPDGGIYKYTEVYNVYGPGGESIDPEELPLSRSILRGESCVSEELVLRRKDGDIPISVNSSPIYDEAGKLVGAVAVFQDVSPAKEKQRVLQRNLDRQSFRAHELQAAFLPSSIPDIPGFQVAQRYEPAEYEMGVGGDFYDVIDMGDDRYGIVMADVSGKGVRAAVYTAMAKYMLHGYAHEDPEPLSVLRRLNNALVGSVRREVFITMFYGVLYAREGRLVYVNAGHEEPIILRGDTGELEILDGTGTALGIVEDGDYVQEERTMSPGDVLVLYTDGITEARRGKETLGPERLLAIMREAPRSDAQLVIDHLIARTREFSGGRNQRDDVALLVLRAASDGYIAEVGFANGNTE